VIYDASLDELLQKVWDGKRINAAEAKRLSILPLEELGALADHRRQLAKAKAYGNRGNEIVTYNVDRNVNYTNVCNVYCKFCAFYRTEKDLDSYVISHAEMDQKIEETLALGGTQILMQGGHHPKLSKQWYLDLLSHIKAKFPQVNIHGFSPSEFIHFREVFNEPLEKIVGDFKAAGSGFNSRRRRRNSRGPRAPADFAAQGDEQRLARGHGRGASARTVFQRNDDVRPRGDDRRSH
jgi:cyclic dehypoxanthinyl futalosine synthase